MASDALKELFTQGLKALHTMGETGNKIAAANSQAASAPELKQALQEGAETARQQSERSRQLFQMVGAQPGGIENPIAQGIAAANQHIIDTASDTMTRDAGMIATAQIAHHYYIAAFGTLGAYAKALGMTEAASLLSEMVSDSKRMDERYTQVAEQVVNPKASA